MGALVYRAVLSGVGFQPALEMFWAGWKPTPQTCFVCFTPIRLTYRQANGALPGLELDMKLRWLLVLSLVVSSTLSVLSPTLSAQEDKAAAHLARLLDVGWGTTTSFRTAADAQSEALFSAAGRQPSAVYAAALVQI